MDKNPDEFRRLNQQLEHLKKMVVRYKQAENWEKLTFSDRVMIDNSDSIHDGAIGKFITHQWSSSGFVCLLVEFEDGSRHYYLPIHLVKHFDVEKMTAQDLEPLRSRPTPALVAESEPTATITLDEASERIIEAKLAQVVKMPESVRKKVLSSTLAAELVPQALELAVKRGIIPAF